MRFAKKNVNSYIRKTFIVIKINSNQHLMYFIQEILCMYSLSTKLKMLKAAIITLRQNSLGIDVNMFVILSQSSFNSELLCCALFISQYSTKILKVLDSEVASIFLFIIVEFFYNYKRMNNTTDQPYYIFLDYLDLIDEQQQC